MHPSAERRLQKGAKKIDDHGRGEHSRVRVVHFMPDELTIEILSYLPSKSLMRFKSVCKYWLSEIESPSFISKHYNRPTNGPRILLHQCQQLLSPASVDTITSGINYFSSFSPSNVSQVHSLHFDPRIDFARGTTQLFGPVDGIFCIYNRDSVKVALWNPATNELKYLPRNHHLFRDDGSLKMVPFLSVFVFGLNPVTNCYKVVWSVFEITLAPDLAHVWIYDLGTAHDDGSGWRSVISSFEKLDNYWDLSISYSGMYMKGVCYWTAEELSRNQYTLLALDMATEVLRKVTVPHYKDYLYYCLEYLFPEESIALIISYDRDGKDQFRHFDTWAMEEEGSFIKRCTSSSFNYQRKSDDKNPLDVIGLWGSGDEVWMERDVTAGTGFDKILVLNKLHVDHKEEILKTRPVQFYVKAYIYKESLTTIRTTA